MDNEDTRRMGPPVEQRESRLPTSEVFSSVLLSHLDALDSLAAALAARDCDAFQVSANDAFSFLLTAISLFRRLETAEHAAEHRDPQRIGTAWYAVRTHHRAFLDLLERAEARLPSPKLLLWIEQHRISLKLALKGIGPHQSPAET